MAKSKPHTRKAKLKVYIAYAQHCLNTVKSIPDRETRILFREMAAEWLNLAAAPLSDAKPVNALPRLIPSRRQYRSRRRASQ